MISIQIYLLRRWKTLTPYSFIHCGGSKIGSQIITSLRIICLHENQHVILDHSKKLNNMHAIISIIFVYTLI